MCIRDRHSLFPFLSHKTDCMLGQTLPLAWQTTGSRKTIICRLGKGWYWQARPVLAVTILSCTSKLPLTPDLASWCSAVLLLAICSAAESRFGDYKVGALSPTQKHRYTSCDNRKKAGARWTSLLQFWRHKGLWRLEHCTSVSSMCSKVICYSHQATMILYSKETRSPSLVKRFHNQ